MTNTIAKISIGVSALVLMIAIVMTNDGSGVVAEGAPEVGSPVAVYGTPTPEPTPWIVELPSTGSGPSS